MHEHSFLPVAIHSWIKHWNMGNYWPHMFNHGPPPSRKSVHLDITNDSIPCMLIKKLMLFSERSFFSQVKGQNVNIIHTWIWSERNKRRQYSKAATAYSFNLWEISLCTLHSWLAVLLNANCYLDYPITVRAHQFTLICVLIRCSKLNKQCVLMWHTKHQYLKLFLWTIDWVLYLHQSRKLWNLWLDIEGWRLTRNIYIYIWS